MSVGFIWGRVGLGKYNLYVYLTFIKTVKVNRDDGLRIFLDFPQSIVIWLEINFLNILIVKIVMNKFKHS